MVHRYIAHIQQKTNWTNPLKSSIFLPFVPSDFGALLQIGSILLNPNSIEG